MNPKIHYLLELSKLVGRLGYALDLNDNAAFLGILHQIRTLTDKVITASTPRLFRVVDILEDADDDEL